MSYLLCAAGITSHDQVRCQEGAGGERLLMAEGRPPQAGIGRRLHI